jgi:hypothetical protein
VFDFSKTFKQASDTAREEEKKAQSLLWERLTTRAFEDPDFKKRLVAEPKKVIEMEAKNLQDQSGQNVEVPTSVVHDVTARARDTFSAAVGEIDLKQVTDLVFGTIKDVRRSFNLTLVLCQVLFYAGLAMVAAAFIMTLIGGKQWASILFGVSGVASVLISAFVLGPLDRIRDAAGNLIQLQMAYLAYYNQLYLLGGGRNLQREEAFLYAQEIDRAALSMIGGVSHLGRQERDASSKKKVSPQLSSPATSGAKRPVPNKTARSEALAISKSSKPTANREARADN